MHNTDDNAARYPLGEHQPERIHSRSGVPFDEITLDAVRDGRIESGDLAIDRETLVQQADIAAQAGYRQLSGNLRRAAELVEIPDERLLRIYEALRPGRSTYQELLALSDDLQAEFGASANADLIRQAAEAYRDGGLLRDSS
jgi:propanediol dehydratase small subunit